MRTQWNAVNGFELTTHPLRRRNLRVPCQVPARVDQPRRMASGVCVDLSLGGILFVGPALWPDEPVNVSLQLPKAGTVRIPGHVLGARTHSAGSAYAIRFRSLTQTDLQLINRFVAIQFA
jgi:hypothetical protein